MTDATKQTLGDGTIVNIYGPKMVAVWDPVTDAVVVSFESHPYAVVGGKTMRLLDDVVEVLPSVEIKPALTDVYFPAGSGEKDPVTGVSLDGISLAGILALCKKAYSVGYNDEFVVYLARKQTEEVQQLLSASTRSNDLGGSQIAFTTALENGTLTITPTYTPAPGETIMEYGWLFGDGKSDITRAPAQHTYSRPGVYNIIGLIKDSTGAVVRNDHSVSID